MKAKKFTRETIRELGMSERNFPEFEVGDVVAVSGDEGIFEQLTSHATKQSAAGRDAARGDHHGLPGDRRGVGADPRGPYARVVRGHGGRQRAAVLAKLGQRVGDGGVFHAAAFHGNANAA